MQQIGHQLHNVAPWREIYGDLSHGMGSVENGENIKSLHEMRCSDLI